VAAAESGAAQEGFGGAMLWSSGDRRERATGWTPPTALIESGVDFVRCRTLTFLAVASMDSV
jgi:hypothetical protein